MTDEVKTTSGGDVPTLPGQTEIVAGTVEHEKELNAYPNATSYSPDVNVVQPPSEEPPPDPPSTLSGAAATNYSTKHDTKPNKDKS